MSSSSSLAAARRRRAGGIQPIQKQSPSRVQPPNRPSENAPSPNEQKTPPNPYMLLQQHDAKINAMEGAIRELVSRERNNNRVIHTDTESDSNGVQMNSQQSQFDLTELSDLIMSRIEATMDLKAFYDNDEKLSQDVDSLQKTIASQEITINGLHDTLHYIIQNLGLSTLNSSENNSLHVNTDDHTELTSDNDSLHNEQTLDKGSNNLDTVPDVNNILDKSVTIDEGLNEVNEFSQMDDDDESNYHGSDNEIESQEVANENKVANQTEDTPTISTME